MKLAIISPSYINSWKRLIYAKRAYHSLLGCGGSDYTTIIVNDQPGFSGFLAPLHRFTLLNPVKNLYSDKNTHLVHNSQPIGSTNALLVAAKTAQKKGYDLVFIHLDDHIYLPIFKKLLKYSIKSFESDSDLQLIRLTARPILSHLCDVNKGNTSFLDIAKDKVGFEQIVLKPMRFQDFTLWSSSFTLEAITNYFAIPMWFAIYRTDYLIKLLEFPDRKKVNTLGKVELFYQNKSNWQKFIKDNPGKFGYVNMQFAGLETHRNKNWKQLINYPNIKVL